MPHCRSLSLALAFYMAATLGCGSSASPTPGESPTGTPSGSPTKAELSEEDLFPEPTGELDPNSLISADLSLWHEHFDPSDKQSAKEEAPVDSKTWSVKNRVLICTGKPKGYLCTTEAHANYRLSLQWRWRPGTRGGNSGVLVHVTGEDKVWPVSYEVQLKRDRAGDLLTNETEFEVMDNSRRVERLVKRTVDEVENPVGEWNAMTIACEGERIVVSVNGQKVNEVTDLTQTEGRIAIQSEGQRFTSAT